MNLPKTVLAKDSDIFINENDTTTQKISLGSLINCIKEHEEIAEHFVKQSAVDSQSGVAPLDSSRKIPSANLPFGSAENTVYDGARGQALSDNLSFHLADTATPHAVTKLQVGLSDVDNTAELIDGAPSTLDTLGEIARALQEGNGISDALDAAISTKADQAELDVPKMTIVSDTKIHVKMGIQQTYTVDWGSQYLVTHVNGEIYYIG